jgi:hypothetical protein
LNPIKKATKKKADDYDSDESES